VNLCIGYKAGAIFATALSLSSRGVTAIRISIVHHLPEFGFPEGCNGSVSFFSVLLASLSILSDHSPHLI
jgi:hypothetical protein